MLVISPRAITDPANPARWVTGGGAGSGGGRVRCGRAAEIVGQGLPGHSDEPRERGRVVNRELGEHPAVDVHASDLQALDEPVVGEAVGPRRRVDALDPQPAERPLAVLPVAVGVGHRVQRLLLGLAVHARPLAPVAAGPLEDDATLLVGVDRPLHACHVFDSLKRAGSLAQQSLHLLGVRGRQRHLILEAAGPRARLVLKVVLAVGPAAHDLAGAGQPESLTGTAMRLHLRHVAVVSVPWRAAGTSLRSVPAARWYHFVLTAEAVRWSGPRCCFRPALLGGPGGRYGRPGPGPARPGPGWPGLARRRHRPARWGRPSRCRSRGALGLGVGLPLVRPDHHDHVPAILLRL